MKTLIPPDGFLLPAAADGKKLEQGKRDPPLLFLPFCICFHRRRFFCKPDVLAIELAVSGRIHRTERVPQAVDAGGTAVDNDLSLPSPFRAERGAGGKRRGG